jgi:hypothetical protein
MALACPEFSFLSANRRAVVLSSEIPASPARSELANDAPTAFAASIFLEDYQSFGHLTITRRHVISIEHLDGSMFNRYSLAASSYLPSLAIGVSYRLGSYRLGADAGDPSFFLVMTQQIFATHNA